MKILISVIIYIIMFNGCSFKDQVSMYRKKITLSPAYYATYISDNIKTKLPMKKKYNQIEFEIVDVYNENAMIYIIIKTSHYNTLLKELTLYNKKSVMSFWNICDKPLNVAFLEIGINFIFVISDKYSDKNKSISILIDDNFCKNKNEIASHFYYNGYNKNNYDIFGYDKNGYDKNGYTKRGVKRKE